MFSKAIAAAAVAFSILTVVYGQSQYAAVGPVDVDVSWIKVIVPALASVLYPLLTKFVPGWSSIAAVLKWIVPKVSGGSSNPLLDLLKAINDLEQRALSESNVALSVQCAQMRTQIVEQIKADAVAAKPVEVNTTGDA